jgi:hypothetical protein
MRESKLGCDVGCEKYPRSVSRFHMYFFSFSYEIVLVDNSDDGQEKKSWPNTGRIAIHMMS